MEGDMPPLTNPAMRAISSTLSRLKRRALPRTVGSNCVVSCRRVSQFSTSRCVAPEAERRLFIVTVACSFMRRIYWKERYPSSEGNDFHRGTDPPPLKWLCRTFRGTPAGTWAAEDNSEWV